MNKTLAAVIAVFFFLFFSYWFEFTIIVWSIAGLIVLFGIVVIYFYCMLKCTELKAANYDAKAKKYKSFQDGFGMTHLLNLKTDTIENLSAFPGTHHNGRWEEPPPLAIASWQMLISKRSEQTPVKMISEPQQQSLDLLTIFTQPSQSYAIIAGQQVGKTYQACMIASYWLRQNVIPIVIGPKHDQGEWSGCQVYGKEYNFDEVQEGMKLIENMARERHSDGVAHKQHSIQPVFFDDWTATKQRLGKDAERFIVEATVLYASVNIILYFIIHLDTANAWGVGKVGAALKDNFIKLLIEPGYDENGLISRRHNRGFLMRPGDTKKDRVPIKLFDSVAVSSLVIEDKDSHFIRLVKEGMSRQQAAQEVYGRDYAGTSFVRKCKTLLGEIK